MSESTPSAPTPSEPPVLSGNARLKYIAAFISGYVGALLPVLATGDWPTQKALVAALAPAILATGLIHCPSPCPPKNP